MKEHILASALFLQFGMPSVYGQVNLSEMPLASTDSLHDTKMASLIS